MRRRRQSEKDYGEFDTQGRMVNSNEVSPHATSENKSLAPQCCIRFGAWVRSF